MFTAVGFDSGQAQEIALVPTHLLAQFFLGALSTGLKREKHETNN
jgi:hypothetical protein